MSPKTLSMKSMQLYADGNLTSVYPGGSDGRNASLILQLTEGLRIHAGGNINVRRDLTYIFCTPVINNIK